MMFRGLRWRIAFLYTALVSVILLGLGIFLTGYISRVYTSNLTQYVTSQAMTMADMLSGGWQTESGDGDVMNRYAGQWADDVNGRVTILTADGTVIGESDYDTAGMENHLIRPEIQQALREGAGVSTRFSITLRTRLMYAAAPVVANGQTAGFVRLALPLDEVDQSIRQVQTRIWWILTAVILLGALLSYAGAQWIARPIMNIAQLADQLTADRHTADRHTADKAGGGKAVQFPYLARRDEIGRLSQSLERMARQLHERIDDLQNEQQKMSGLLSQMSDGVIIIDPDGQISLINLAAEQTFNTASVNAVGQSLVRAFGYFQLHELWETTHKTGEGNVISLEMVPQKRFLQVIATPLGGALQNFTLLLCQDMTHIRRLETVRRDFISNISHELRTPLASLKALTETLQLGAIDDPQNARHFLDRMETEIDALTQMVNELLELARIESGRVPLSFKPEDPCRLGQNAINRLAMQAERAGLVLQMNCPDDLPQIMADGPRLEQVLVNIIHNAIKFTPAGGRIDLTVTRQDQAIRFSVRDTGVGIPDGLLPRVFERFYKTDPSRAEGGTGLGLSIARHLVEAHSGRIWAESQVGQGSAFHFTIPILIKQKT